MKLYQIRCPKCNNNHLFYRYSKDRYGYQKHLCRKCHHQFAPERPRAEGQIVGGNIRPAPYAEKHLFCTTTMSIIQTTVAATRSAITLSLNGNPLPLPLPPCPRFSGNIILSVCGIPFRSLSRLCLCFILAKFPFEISAWYSRLPLISRFLILLSAIGALNSLRCLTICGFSFFPY